LPLDTKNCCLLCLCYSNDIPIFPVLVACVFSELKEPFLHEKEGPGDIFSSYLKKFNQILKENSELDDINITEISKKENIKPHLLKLVLQKLKTCVLILRETLKIKFEIGTYDCENLIKKIIPHYEVAYSSETYILIDKGKHLYKNKDIICKLEPEKFNYKLDNVPSRIFSFYKIRLNRERDSIQRGKNIIYYYIHG